MYLLNLSDTTQDHSCQTDLHSTMYLLNRIVLSTLASPSIFTFHYVSIKSTHQFQEDVFLNLFTFHYVSIKSHAVNVRVRQPCKFTFHYVSIKS